MSKMYGNLLKHDINPLDEITISIGGYNALFMAIFAFINPGDEVYIFSFRSKT